MQASDSYTATSSFKQTSDDTDEEGHHARKHVIGQQPPSYVAVLNDPAMKKKLKERNSRLQNQ